MNMASKVPYDEVLPRWFLISLDQIEAWKKEDGDLHKKAAAWVYEIPIEEVTAVQRGESKRMLFMSLYGASDFDLGKAAIDVSEADALAIQREFNASFPELVKYFQSKLEPQP